VFLEVYPQVLGVSTLKRCPKCGELKPREMFSRNKTNRDGLHSRCKACHASEMNEYRIANRDLVNEQAREWYSAHREEQKECKRVRYQENHAHILEQTARSRESRKDIRRVRREEQREQLRAYYRDYSKSPVGKAAKHRRKARKRALLSSFTGKDWQSSLNFFGGCCAVCGRQPGLWHTIAADHWIPLASSDCPGTVPWNIVPLCHGNGGCNNSKQDKSPRDWLIDRFGKRKGRAILQRIEVYLESRKLAEDA
jgi:hypothetical protein